MPSPRRPLIVRLRNWIGDVVLGVPALDHLHASGWDLTLIGKPWARDLLGAKPWTVLALPKTFKERHTQLRALAAAFRKQDPGFDRRVNMLVQPYSFSSALDARLAGLKGLGYRHESRGWLLHRALDRPQGGHEIDHYWRLCLAVTGETDARLPDHIELPVTAAAEDLARQRLAAAGIAGRYVVLCPFAGGLLSGKDRHWPDFPAFAQRLKSRGLTLVLCPGPAEIDEARRDFPDLHRFDGVGLAEYAALLKGADLMVSNDTGPGHIAAAVGTPVLSILGPTKPEQWRAWGPQVRTLRVESGWPSLEDVDAQFLQMRKEHQHD